MPWSPLVQPLAHLAGSRGRRHHPHGMTTPAPRPTQNQNDLRAAVREGAAMTLEGKVAIVTGGNSGIGKAIALALARRKANIVIDYVAQEHATEELEHEIEALGDRATGVKADVSKVDDLQRMIDHAVKTFGRLDVMVN